MNFRCEDWRCGKSTGEDPRYYKSIDYTCAYFIQIILYFPLSRKTFLILSEGCPLARIHLCFDSFKGNKEKNFEENIHIYKCSSDLSIEAWDVISIRSFITSKMYLNSSGFSFLLFFFQKKYNKIGGFFLFDSANGNSARRMRTLHCPQAISGRC